MAPRYFVTVGLQRLKKRPQMDRLSGNPRAALAPGTQKARSAGGYSQLSGNPSAVWLASRWGGGATRQPPGVLTYPATPRGG